jgi:hypothetical protein
MARRAMLMASAHFPNSQPRLTILLVRVRASANTLGWMAEANPGMTTKSYLNVLTHLVIRHSVKDAGAMGMLHQSAASPTTHLALTLRVIIRRKGKAKQE